MMAPVSVVGKDFPYLRENFQFLDDSEGSLSELYDVWSLRTSRRTTENLRSLNDTVNDFRIRITGARVEKYANEDIVAMETNYSLLKELSEDKQKCMETLMNITEIEEYYQTVSAEVDSRALHLCTVPCSQDENPGASGDRNTLARHYNTCVYAVRSAWDWLIQEAKCQDVHLRNAAQYHQFHFEVKHYDQGLKTLLASVHHYDTDTDQGQRDAHAYVKEIQEVLQQFLDYQSKVEELFALSGNIIPLHLRKYPSDEPIKIKALTSYKQSDITVVEGEDYLLLDNTEITKWKIRSFTGQEGMVPAIVFLIPPPDKTAVTAASRLRQQLHATWRDCISIFKDQARQFFSKHFTSHDGKQLRCLNPSQRGDVCRCLSEVGRVLCNDGVDPNSVDLYHTTHDWANMVKSMEGTTPDRRGIASSLVLHWTGSKKLLRLLEESELYATAYEEEVKSSRGTKNCFMMDKDGSVNYTSKAYVEKLRPVDIDHLVPESLRDRLPTMPHVTVAEKVPVIPEESWSDESQIIDSVVTVRNAMERNDDEVESEQTIKETQTFVIVGVIDPRDEQQISIYRAISEGIVSQTKGTYMNLVTGEVIPIPEAMNRGLILVEYTNRQIETGELIKKGIIRTTTSTDSVSYAVQAVTDPVTGRKISVKEAVKRGIIDQENGLYVNPMTGESMSIVDAIDQGLLDVRPVGENGENNNTKDVVDGYVNGDSLENRDVLVQGVRDPTTGRFISLPEAIAKGIIDAESGDYVNIVTGERMPLSDALSRGYLQASLADPSQDKNANLLSVRALTVRKGSISLESLEDLLSATGHSPVDLNHTIYSKIKGNLDTSKKGIREQTTGRDMTIQEAFDNGVLHFNPLHIENANGDKYSLTDAAILGLIETKTLEEILKGIEPCSLHKLIENKQIDTHTGQYIDPDTKTPVSLAEAIAREHIDPDQIFFLDLPSASVSSLSSAFENKRWDPETGLVYDPKHAQEVTLNRAIDQNVIDPKVDAEKIAEQISALKFLQASMDTNMDGIQNTRTGEGMTIEEAIMAGILDIPNGEYIDPATQQTMSIPEAVRADLIDPKTAKKIFAAMAQETLKDLLDKHHIDPNTGKFIHPETKRKMTIKEAIDAGHLDPNSVFLLDPESGKVSSLASFIKEGRFNPVTGKFKDPLTNLEVSIASAIKKGIIQPSFDPEEFIEEKNLLKKLIDSGKVNTNDAIFVTPDGVEMSLKEAISQGYVTGDSIVKKDPKTGKLSLAGRTDLLEALVATSGELDFVTEIEGAIVSMEEAVEDEAALLHQVAEHEKLQGKVSHHMEPVKEILGASQQLLDDNRDVKLKHGEQQQYQRLRFNASDLKVRFEAVNTQLDSRLGTLSEMLGDLEGFHDNLNNFDAWAEDTATEMEGIRHSAADMNNLESIREHFEEVNDRALDKEDDIEALNKAGRKVQQDKKSYDKLTEEYLQNVVGSKHGVKQRPVQSADQSDKSVVEQELATANEKFKGILADCTDLMTKLTDTASKNKQYNQLKAQLTKSLPDVAGRVEECDTEVKPGVDTSGQLDALKAVTADVISQGKMVEDMSKVGQELISILEELDCKDTPKAKEIQNTVDQIQGMFDQIQETTVNKQHKLNNAIVQSQDAMHNLDATMDWVCETESLFDNIRPVSLDRAALNEQIQAHRVITSDIDNHREQVDSIIEQCKGQPGSEEKINNLLDRFDNLISRAHDRGNELEEIVQKLGTLHGNVNQLESWLASAVNSMKRESSDFEPSSLKNKIENLYRQKQKKQEDLNTIKKIGKALISDPNTGEKNRLRETMADIQGKWHDLTELLVQMISFTALREIDDLLKYLDKAESEINTAEPVSTDPETLSIQLRDHKAFHDDLEGKRRAVNDTIDKCNKMLRETTNEEADDIKNKLDTIRSQADLVCKLSGERLALLQEALPLASHFSETHADLQSWLGEIEAEIESLDVPAECNAEQVRKQQDSAKMTQRIIEDHKPLVHDLKNTGLELMELCTDEDASDLKEDLDHITQKYDDVKGAIREKLNQLDDAFRSVTSDVNDTLDGLLEELHYLHDQSEHADPVAANPEVIRDQIAENHAIMDDLERRQVAIKNTKQAVGALLEQESPETKEECEDLRSKLQDVSNLTDSIRSQTHEMGQKLEETLGVAEKYRQDQQMALQSLRDIHDNLLSQDSPGIDPATISEQLKELQAIEQDLDRAEHPISECKKTGEHLASLCGVPGQTEIQKVQEDVDMMLEEIHDAMKERQEELNSASERAQRYDQTLEAINSWLPQAETRLSRMPKIAADPRTAKIQIEELKVFKVTTHPRYVDIQNLNQYCSDLKNLSPLTAESILGPQVKEVNVRWNNILKGIQDREKSLQDALVEMGEIDHTMDDVIGFLQQTESELGSLDDIYGDPRFIETYLKKIQMTQKDLQVQDRCIQKLNRAVDALVERSGTGRSTPLQDKRDEMNEMFRTVNVLARDKQNQLQETLKEVKGFMGDVDDLIRWLTDFRIGIKSSGPMGALPETAQKQFEKYMTEYENLGRKEEEGRMLLLNGEDMMSRCREQDAQSLRENLARLQVKLFDTRNKAERKKVKMEEHLENVHAFHNMLKDHTDWLSNAEKVLASFKHPSKLVDRVVVQIQDHKEFRSDIEAHRELMMNLDRTGTFLKYFGRKQDTVYIKNLLISIKLRWKKLVRRADEKGRMLNQAYKEDKRMYDAWKGLCDWLEESERKMKKYATSAPAKVKQDIDELRMFQHQLGAKHPIYYTTMRLGRSLKDRCTKTDQEREILHSMLEELKNRWNIIRSIVAQKQNKLDEALLSSGRLVDALKSLTEWLEKAETYVSEDQPTLGDLDTVNLLIEQHKAFQQELESRQTVFMAMQASPSNDSNVEVQLDDLNALWTRVNQLSEVREARLQEALKLAEDFNDAVQIIREWLPHAEAELKFRSLPEDEDAIGIVIEQHERLQEELRGQQPNLEKIAYLAEEILQGCHPNAIRFVKYYLTITQTRWEQALNRADQRSQRLQEALRNIRGNAALLEELLAQLTEAQALLATKEKDPIPEDLMVVEALVKEHLEFHEDLSNKNKDVDRLTKSVNVSLKKQLHGSAWKLNECDQPSPRATTLQNKWRTVWRVSVDRKKKLQDALDQLLELESFKNFDFDLWRQRYVAWIRAKKFRITDFFRRQDKDQDGALTRHEFVEGMLTAKFPTNKTELNAVFDIFDRNRNNLLDYKEFVDALKPDRGQRSRTGKHPATDAEMVDDEIEQQISHCQCRQQFQVHRIGEGKYKFGEKGKLYLVRFLNSTVMVRVGGGWVTLQEFLQTNDPCRAKGRTNTEMREQFVLPDGAAQSRASFLSRRRSSQPSNGSSPSSPASALGTKLSGSASSLSSLGKSNKSGLKVKQKQAPKARSCMDLSRGGDTSIKRGLNPPVTARTTPRRGIVAGVTSNDQQTPPRGGRKTPISTPRSTISNGRATPTGARTPTGSVTPNGSRSRSPGRISSTPKSASSTRSNVGSRSSLGSRSSVGSVTPGSRTPTGSRTPQGQRSRSPVSTRSETPTQRKLASANRTMRF